MRQRQPGEPGGDDGFQTIYSSPAYQSPLPETSSILGAQAAGLGAAPTASANTRHEWDSEAIKWNAHSLTSPANRGKLIALVVVVLLVVGGLWLAFKPSPPPPLENVTPTLEEAIPEVDTGAMISQCAQKCLQDVGCDRICRHVRSRSPRPTLWNSCRAGCSQVRKDICHRSCEIELDEKRRNNIMLCRNGVSRKCETICQPFHAKLPRPLMYNICEEACETTAKEGCEAGHGAMAHIRDLQDATAFLADGK